MDDNRIDALHGKVDDLIDLCGKLRQENQRLKVNEQDLRSERRQLLEKNREAKQRLQSILMRLKAMENP
ncbi:MAG: TIGR02449 family protein [Gammaproteobacteria bacterium]|nr:TIGR02449 family protein [Gammaproteobacteria bacterium]MYH47225.1 TIGR02449 family protein [Gammaproteobacteria bacterium]MYL13049.1 TIGR02449 family protein [Gammaproteobacteria bacterium]